MVPESTDYLGEIYKCPEPDKHFEEVSNGPRSPKLCFGKL